MNFSWSAFYGGGGAWAGSRHKVVVAVEGRVVTVVAEHTAVAVAEEGRHFVVCGSRWLGWEVVERGSGAEDRAVAVVVAAAAAANHPTHVSFAYW